MSAEHRVASIIYQQLGAGRFTVMTGAKNFSDEGNLLRFHLPANFAKNGINMVIITLDPSDTYTVEFIKRGNLSKKTLSRKITQVAKHEGVYGDMLRSLFEQETGLSTSL